MVLSGALALAGCLTEFVGVDAPGDGGISDGGDAGDAGPGCGPHNCVGCCDLLGACQQGDTEPLCGTGGALCQDCTLTPGQLCLQSLCQVPTCADGDGDGYGEYCDNGPDACDDDASNWTEGGCADCSDPDGDGHRGMGCDLSEDACETDDHNWTPLGCTSCSDNDNDGLRGTDCDLPEDCDDNARGIVVPCQANGCPEGWVHIPAGSFEMGCNAGELDNTCDNDEMPRHTVTLSAYCLQPTEVSVAMFRACADDGPICDENAPSEVSENALCNWTLGPGNRESHPLNCIAWQNARPYCQTWMGGDFPSEAQWEKAARGDTDTRKYPWGDSPEPTCSRCNWNQCYSASAPSTWPVGHLTTTAGDSPYGLKDMAGNLWEMTRDTYRDDVYLDCFNGCTDPVNTDNGTNIVIRGGGYYHPTASYLRVTERAIEDRVSPSLNLGWRCRRTP